MSAMEVDLEDKKKAVEDAKEEEPDVVDPLREALVAADDSAAMTPASAEKAYLTIVHDTREDDIAIKVREEALYRLRSMPQGIGTFSDIETFILRTLIF